jgi:hypothetical protein
MPAGRFGIAELETDRANADMGGADRAAVEAATDIRVYGRRAEENLSAALAELPSMSIAASCRDYGKMFDAHLELTKAVHTARLASRTELKTRMDSVAERMLAISARNNNVVNRLEELEVLMENEHTKWKEKLASEKDLLREAEADIDLEAVGLGDAEIQSERIMAGAES